MYKVPKWQNSNDPGNYLSRGQMNFHTWYTVNLNPKENDMKIPSNNFPRV